MIDAKKSNSNIMWHLIPMLFDNKTNKFIKDKVFTELTVQPHNIEGLIIGIFHPDGAEAAKKWMINYKMYHNMTLAVNLAEIYNIGDY